MSRQIYSFSYIRNLYINQTIQLQLDILKIVPVMHCTQKLTKLHSTLYSGNLFYQPIRFHVVNALLQGRIQELKNERAH